MELYSFTIPLVYLLINILIIKKNIFVSNISKNLFDSSMFTFVFGSIVKGILEIYGTTNSLVIAYLIVGIVLLLFSLLFLTSSKN